VTPLTHSATAAKVRLALAVARHAAGTLRPGGTLLLMSGTLDVDGGQQVERGHRA
jgi:hypothetical protein